MDKHEQKCLLRLVQVESGVLGTILVDQARARARHMADVDGVDAYQKLLGELVRRLQMGDI